MRRGAHHGGGQLSSYSEPTEIMSRSQGYERTKIWDAHEIICISDSPFEGLARTTMVSAHGGMSASARAHL